MTGGGQAGQPHAAALRPAAAQPMPVRPQQQVGTRAPQPAYGPQVATQTRQAAQPMPPQLPQPVAAASEPEPLPNYEAPAGYAEPQQQHRPQGTQPRPPQPPLPPQHQRTPTRAADPRQSVRGNNGLFAAEPAPQPPAPPAPRRSLFGIVTGAMRGGHAEAIQPQPQPQPEPAPHEPRGEQLRANVRQAGGEDMHIDIPAFLRRQSS
jgi:cell division protein FtsZ